MSAQCFTLFATTIGQCAVIWGELGIVRMLLPHASEAAMREVVHETYPKAIEKPPNANAKVAILGIRHLLAGGTPNFSTLILDMEKVPEFHREVYAHTRRIPPGTTLSYGDIAARLGKPNAARAVGQALGRNPWALIVPCHRVLAANGRLTGFSAPGGVATKRRLLEIEGVSLTSTR